MCTPIYLYVLTALLGCLTGLVGDALRVIIIQADLAFQYLSVLSPYSVVISMCLSTILVYLAFYWVSHFAPEASGSGIQEIEGFLQEKRLMNWRTLLPAKFFAGAMVLVSKMLLGREGPTIQLGGNLGAMLADTFNFHRDDKHTLVAAGAAAGLATAFNAPLAGILFVSEEMRKSFGWSTIRFKHILLCVVTSTLMNVLMMGGRAQLDLPSLSMPSLASMPMFMILGVLVGGFGWLYNFLTVRLLYWSDNLKHAQKVFFVLSVAALIGLFAINYPLLVGEGYDLIEHSIQAPLSLQLLSVVFLIRFILGIFCYGTGVPGGIFAPMLALGTLLGLIIFHTLESTSLYFGLSGEMFAVAAMGALFAATVQAPITGILLVIEITHHYDFILPLMVASLTSCLVAQGEHNRPIYERLLERTLLGTSRRR